MYDVIIVGAGPAGLSAALLLGRCGRSVLICDSGEPRNAPSRALHGFLTRDGISPEEFLRIGREQLTRYPGVQFRHTEVRDAECRPGSFEVTLDSGEKAVSRILLLATGVVDRLPDMEGLDAFYGTSVFHCPYCDGWEVTGGRLAAYGKRSNGVDLALELTCWSDDIVLLTDGRVQLSEESSRRLDQNGIQVYDAPVAALVGTAGKLERVVFEDGSSLTRDALFFKTAFRQHSDLPEQLGCDFTNRGAVDTGEYEWTDVPGLYVAGDASRRVQLAVVAAAEGAQAAFAINNALLAADLA